MDDTVDPNIEHNLDTETSGGPDYTRAELEKDVLRTKYGIMAFASGMAMLWIPYIKYVGYLTCFIGLAYLVFGRKAFGAKHERFLVTSIIWFLFSVIVVLDIESLTLNSALNNYHTVSSLISIVDEFVLEILVVSSIISISFVLPVWKLAGKFEKILLLGGVLGSFVVSIVIYFLMVPNINVAVNAYFHNPNSTLLNGSIDQLTYLSMLNVLWYAILIAAYWLVYTSIDNDTVSQVKMQIAD